MIDQAPAAPVHATARFKFSSNEPASFECRLDGGVWTPCDTDYVLSLSGVLPGEHRLAVRAVDAAGNADPAPPETTFTVVNAAPTATLALRSTRCASPPQVMSRPSSSQPTHSTPIA